MASQFTTTRRVEFIDTDMAGIIHFSNFYRYMEEAESQFFRSLGLKLIEKRGDGTSVGWPRLYANCSFRAPAYFEDVLEIALTVIRKSKKSLTMNFEFRRGETLIAVGEVKAAYCLFRPGEKLVSLEIPAQFDTVIEAAPPAGDDVSP